MLPFLRQNLDFYFWQYNNTEQALKVFKNNFGIAVPNQARQDYTRREIEVRKCEKSPQWMFSKPKNEILYRRLHDDFGYKTLALKNRCRSPGFRKGNAVQENT